MDIIDSKKGEDIIAIDVSDVTSIARYIIVVTTTSTVHSNSLAKHILDFFENNKLRELLFNKNPELNNPWILIDATDIIINIFQREARDFYALEKLYFKGKMIFKS